MFALRNWKTEVETEGSERFLAGTLHSALRWVSHINSIHSMEVNGGHLQQNIGKFQSISAFNHF